MDFLHAVFFAILQGASELFPVSSLGHAVIVPALLHWNVDQAAPGFLPFLVMLHLGTAIGMMIYFWRDWLDMLRGVLGRGYAVEIALQRGMVLKLIAATIPAIIIGIIVRKPVQHLFASPSAASLFLIVNAGILLLGEKLRGRAGRRGENLSYTDAVIIGMFQCLAFLPGISSSGAAIIGGLRRGISHEGSAKFAFLMGTPIILAASIVEIPKLLHGHEVHALFGIAFVAAFISGAVAFASTAFLMRYFRDHDAWALKPFAYYCGVFGAVSFALLTVGL